MRYVSKLVVTVLLLIVAPFAALAQDECAAIFQQAIQSANDACGSIGRNQLCYGAGSMSAQGADGLNFSDVGDVVDAASVQSLSMKTSEVSGWNVAVMRLQFNLPDKETDQNVAVLLFGNVELTNGIGAAPALATVNIAATKSANIRNAPSKNGAVLGSMTKDENVAANGRNADGTWLRFQFAEGQFGWVFADLVTIEGDVNTLAVVDESEQAEKQPVPMSSFSFTSGGGSGKCADNLPSGILMQSPDGLPNAETAQIKMMINGASVDMGSTVYMEAVPGGSMSVGVLEHYAEVVVDEIYQMIPEGYKGDMPMEGREVSGPPELTDLSQYADALNQLGNMLEHGLEDNSELINRTITLPDQVFTPQDADADDPDTSASTTVEQFPPDELGDQFDISVGPWWIVFDNVQGNCPVNPNVLKTKGMINELDSMFVFDNVHRPISYKDLEYQLPLDNPIENYYIAVDSDDIFSSQYQFEVQSPFLIIGAMSASINDGYNACVMTIPIFMQSCAFVAIAPKSLPASVETACKSYNGTPITG